VNTNNTNGRGVSAALFQQPANDAEAITYAWAMENLHGTAHVAVRLPAGNRFGLTHAAVRLDEVVEYVNSGASIVPLTKETLAQVRKQQSAQPAIA
jgi:hypothetical protein